MLTLKCVVMDCAAQPTSNSPVPVKHFTMYEADIITVRRFRGASTEGRDPDYEVELRNIASGGFTTLPVGPGLDHFQTIYVLNRDGKTVESIHALR